MKITHKSSTEVYKRLLETDRSKPVKPIKRLNESPYSIDKKSVVAVVRTEKREEGIIEGIKLLGGLRPILNSLDGDIIIKPNCNTDDPFPRNTDAETIRIIAISLIKEGLAAERIVVGDMSGRYRGLPTRYTMENMGITDVAEELGIQTAYFDEEDWVTVKHPLAKKWLNGIIIPKRIYEAGRVIFTPIMRPHEDSVFSLCMKLGVGLMDVKGRDYLHNGESFFEKLLEFNLAFSVDLSIVDGMSLYIDSGPAFTQVVKPGLIIIGDDRVSTDAVAVSVMKRLGAHGVVNSPVLKNEQFIWAEKLGLGKPRIDNIILKSSNLTESRDLDEIVSTIKEDLLLDSNLL